MGHSPQRAIGPTIRSLFGCHEKYVSGLYRRLFVDLWLAVKEIEAISSPKTILEIGCGEGALTEVLARCYPKAHIVGTDISPQVGRLFEGDRSNVTFVQKTTQDFELTNKLTFDLVVICDVMHHVSQDLHREMLAFAKRMLRPNGLLALKEWERRTNPVHGLCYLIERYITGDKVVYMSREEIKSLVGSVFDLRNIEKEIRIPPWKNNLLLLIRN
jgi:2-polyprenyl-3-methyl-5-hydroxy-6-metoxy-1,4-benzoquinol methylase